MVRVRFGHLKVFLPLVFAAILSTSAYGQYCVGSTRFAPRDEQGNLFKKYDLKKLTILSIDGKKREVTRTDLKRYTYFYSTKRGNRKPVLEFKENLVFYFGFCNQIRDITLVYKKIKMKLIFDIGILNTNLDISAPPFQSGTFRLDSIDCSNARKPPPIDYENQGSCHVDAKHWNKISVEIIESDQECCETRPKFGHRY